MVFGNLNKRYVELLRSEGKTDATQSLEMPERLEELIKCNNSTRQVCDQ